MCLCACLPVRNRRPACLSFFPAAAVATTATGPGGAQALRLPKGIRPGGRRDQLLRGAAGGEHRCPHTAAVAPASGGSSGSGSGQRRGLGPSLVCVQCSTVTGTVTVQCSTVTGRRRHFPLNCACQPAYERADRLCCSAVVARPSLRVPPRPPQTRACTPHPTHQTSQSPSRPESPAPPQTADAPTSPNPQPPTWQPPC